MSVTTKKKKIQLLQIVRQLLHDNGKHHESGMASRSTGTAKAKWCGCHGVCSERRRPTVVIDDIDIARDGKGSLILGLEIRIGIVPKPHTAGGCVSGRDGLNAPIQCGKCRAAERRSIDQRKEGPLCIGIDQHQINDSVAR